MKNRALTAVIFCLLCAVCEAQRTTELYIPIGRSPGLSIQGKTIIGTVTAINGDTITVGGKSFRVTTDTKIFIDWSAAKKINLYGLRADITVGAFVESFAPEWIKVRGS